MREKERESWNVYFFISQSTHNSIPSYHLTNHLTINHLTYSVIYYTIFSADGEFDGEISNLRPNNPDDIFPYLFNMVRRWDCRWDKILNFYIFFHHPFLFSLFFSFLKVDLYFEEPPVGLWINLIWIDWWSTHLISSSTISTSHNLPSHMIDMCLLMVTPLYQSHSEPLEVRWDDGRLWDEMRQMKNYINILLSTISFWNRKCSSSLF